MHPKGVNSEAITKTSIYETIMRKSFSHRANPDVWGRMTINIKIDDLPFLSLPLGRGLEGA